MSAPGSVEQKYPRPGYAPTKKNLTHLLHELSEKAKARFFEAKAIRHCSPGTYNRPYVIDVPDYEIRARKIVTSSNLKEATEPKDNKDVKDIKGASDVLFRSTRFVVSLPKEGEQTGIANDVKNSQDIFREKKVAPDGSFLFILYHDDQGRKISLEFESFYHKLDAILMAEKGYLDYAALRLLMGQLILGLWELHNKNIVHRDLKFENILIHALTPQDWLLQLCDCDNAIIVDENGKNVGVEAFGNAFFTAPEVTQVDMEVNSLLIKFYRIRLDWQAAERHSLGLLFEELLTLAKISEVEKSNIQDLIDKLKNWPYYRLNEEDFVKLPREVKPEIKAI